MALQYDVYRDIIKYEKQLQNIRFIIYWVTEETMPNVHVNL